MESEGYPEKPHDASAHGGFSSADTVPSSSSLLRKSQVSLYNDDSSCSSESSSPAHSSRKEEKLLQKWLRRLLQFFKHMRARLSSFLSRLCKGWTPARRKWALRLLCLGAAALYLRSFFSDAHQTYTGDWGPTWLYKLMLAAFPPLTALLGRRWGGFKADERATFDRQMMLAWHPHGVVPVGAFNYAGPFCGREGRPVNFFALVASAVFSIPGIRESMLVFNARSADKKTLDHMLSHGKSVALNPGGIHELCRTNHKREVAYFPPNLGQFRAALRHGVPIVPCYLFGENQTYVTTDASRALMTKTYKLFGLPVLLGWGRWGLPFLPYIKGDISVRVGVPVEVPEKPQGELREDLTGRDVAELFAKYLLTLQDLFDREAHVCLPADVAARGLLLLYRLPKRKKGESVDPAVSSVIDSPGGVMELRPNAKTNEVVLLRSGAKGPGEDSTEVARMAVGPDGCVTGSGLLLMSALIDMAGSPGKKEKKGKKGQKEKKALSVDAEARSSGRPQAASARL
uniref:Acyltransferase n=1 Tax=Chromera velia CCMP2878 TaxID=1169474 RepID=A0A0G4IBR9_9ALVE|eukprot:Cvel_12872.t1-p1 / transcript=Cvel_12872.t1 / gene=Cvel_12872 / organism=Chromera_velia_CCMP2878 / gene_product=Diacylglycerol O-acyltransferase 2, putative / transcript_product=Diacylglycerol O-acyltransferase 2, putative / location=Cvel_scaffold859:20646-24636(-) / protein_length=513 / sequence_SO=supercontig / SO=protein_coding / is_pseudo=false